MAASLVERCADVLNAMRGITQTYRMTNKPPPQYPSFFIANILASLAACLRDVGPGLPA